MHNTDGALPAPPRTVAGWHADPLGLHVLRYFDGSAWTDHVTHAAPVPCAGCGTSAEGRSERSVLV